MTKSINIIPSDATAGDEVLLSYLAADQVVNRGTIRLGGAQDGSETLYTIVTDNPDFRAKLTSRSVVNPPSKSSARGSAHVTLRVDTRVLSNDDGVITDVGPASVLLGVNFPGQAMDAALALELVDMLYGIFVCGGIGTANANATRLSQLASELVFAD